MFSLFIATFAMSEIFAFLFCTTKIGEISDMVKCFENFVSQALGFLTSFYVAELRKLRFIKQKSPFSPRADGKYGQ